MSRNQSIFRLGPVTTGLFIQTPCPVALRRRQPRRDGAPAGAKQGRFLAALADGRGFEAACRAAGWTRSGVLLARARDLRFAAAWDELADAQRAAMEAMLLDRGTVALATAPAPAAGKELSAGLDKGTLAFLQWVLGPLKGPRAERATAAKAAPAAATRDSAEADDDEAARMLDRALAQLAAVEAALADSGALPAD